MRIDIALETKVARSFRVDSVAGLFDISVADKSRLELTAHLPEIDGDWKVGAIVGPSGSGKSTVAQKAYGSRFLSGFDWPRDSAIVDAFPKTLGMDAITGALNAVGFSSPPAWVLPYGALSTGQRMRCDLARALLAVDPADQGIVAFDEFTSVVDRQVGQFASAAVAKAVRKGRVPVQRFVAVSCHYDVLDWLEPDWVLDMADRRLMYSPGAAITNAALARGLVQRQEAVSKQAWTRPRIDISLHRASRDNWRLFERHHYLSSSLHPAASVYMATWRDQPVAFCATLANAGHVGRRLVHRLVVLPDYQGMGIGLRVLDAVADLEHDKGYRMGIRTSHPALMSALKHGGPSKRWYVQAFASRGDKQRASKALHSTVSMSGSAGRAVATFGWR